MFNTSFSLLSLIYTELVCAVYGCAWTTRFTLYTIDYTVLLNVHMTSELY